jgi:small neutral amino acid transporter SnatA (MarC family)
MPHKCNTKKVFPIEMLIVDTVFTFMLMGSMLAQTKVSVSSTHPNIDSMLAAGRGYPPKHPLMDTRLAAMLPPGHPSIDAIFAAPVGQKLPAGHRPMEAFLTRRAVTASPGSTAANTGSNSLPSKGFINAPLSMPYWHPNIDTAYKKGIKIPKGHLLFQSQFVSLMPAGHPNVDILMANPLAYPLPPGHPVINDYVTVRARFRAGHFLAAYLSLMLVAAIFFRLSYKVIKFIRGDSRVGDESSSFMLSDAELSRFEFENDPYSSKGSILKNPTIRDSTMSRNRMLNESRKKNLRHKSVDLYEYRDNLPTLKRDDTYGKLVSNNMAEKQNSSLRSIWKNISSARIPRTDWSVGTAMFLTLYILLNLLAILSVNIVQSRAFTLIGFTDLSELRLHFGSLSAANAMILIIPATRNSVLTWVLGLPFDHVVVYHRWIGRWTVTCTVIHGLLYVQDFLSRYSEYVYWTGMGASLSGIIISATSIDWMRRNHFNVFYFSHYFFVSFFALGYLHLQESRIFLLIGTGLYVLDRILRVIWTFFPRKTLLFENKGFDVAQVRFPKNPITQMLGQHKVGQYFFGIIILI